MIIQRNSIREITEYFYDIIDEETDTVRKATIIFENGKFQRCVFPFHNHYTRAEWAVLSNLESEIRVIENQEYLSIAEAVK